MKTSPQRASQGFTLIELMAVITIIVILAGLVVGGMGFVNERQAREKARVQLALLAKAIEEFKLDMGRLPGDANDTPREGTISAQLYVDLFFEGYDFATQSDDGTPPTNWQKTIGGGTLVPKAARIYLPELDPTSTKQGWVTRVTGENTPPPATTPINDPWGNPYRYRKGANAINPDFDLWSSGKNGRTVPDNLNHNDNRDDIRN